MFSRAVRALKGAGDDEQIIKKTYPKIDVNSGFDETRNFDHRRFKKNDELEEEARKMAKDYLKSHNVDNEMVPSLRKYSGTIKDVLDKVAYAALQKYSVTINGITTDYTLPERKGRYPIDTLAKLVGGWFENGELGASVGGWHKRGSQISDKEAEVIFYFNFEKSKDNKDLLIWQGKAQKEPETRSESSYAEQNERVNFVNKMNEGMFKIKEATPDRFTLENGRTFLTFHGLRIYSEKKWDSKPEVFYANSGRFNIANRGYFSTEQRDELQRSYVDTNQIPADNWSSPAAGGRKSTRRRQRRSNTHRRIKQRKQSRKNHTRRRKTIRK